MNANYVYELFEKQVSLRPDAVALVAGEEQVTYSELNRRSNQIAGHLKTLGLKPEEFVGVYLDHSVELLASMLALFKLGVGYVPINPAAPATFNNHIVADTGIKCLLTSKRFVGKVDFVDDNVSQIILEDLHKTSESFNDIHSNFLNKDNPAVVVYTSGSTGKQKGIILSQGNIYELVSSMQKVHKFSEKDIWVCRHAITFVMSILESCSAILFGGKAILLDHSVKQSYGEYVDFLAKNAVTCIALIPFELYEIIKEESNRIQKTLLRLFIMGGGALIRGRVLGFVASNPKISVVNAYGSSEVCGPMTNAIVAVDEDSGVGPVVENCFTKILDDNLEALSWEAGEICIGGARLARGYLNRPDLTAEKFIANPFGNGDRLYRTGDLGRYLPDGNIEFLGRIDNQVKIRGFRIELGEIEAAVNDCNQVKASVALAKDGQLVAYIVPNDVENLEESYKFKTQQDEEITVFDGEKAAELVESVRTKISQKLPEYMVPSYFVVLEKIPLTPNGKTDGKLLQTLNTGKRLSVDEYVAPRNDIERKLCDIWQEVLHLDKVGINDNFFKIGGHSLLATRLISKVRSEFSAEVPLRLLFEHPTIANFAEDVQRHGLNANIPPLTVQEKSERIPLSFAQQRLWVIDKLLPEKALYNIPYGVRLLGRLDYDKLETAINTLIKRHESFRTNFCETTDGDAYQIIASTWNFKLAVENVLPGEVNATAKEEAETPFDLNKDHLLRVRLLKVEENEHVLLITMHHIISDGWSMPVFFNELTKLYNGEDNLPELPITYADYAIWQRNWLKDEALDKQLNYWKNYLADIPDQIDLPYDHQRPAEMTYAGGRVTTKVGAKVYQKLVGLAQNTNTTMFMVMFAAVSCLLRRYSRQEDVVIGTPIANRHYKETEGVIGFFVNTLALRTHFDEADTFKDILAKVKKSVLEGYENQDVPFEYLVDKLNVERRLNVNPLFQVMVVVNKEEKHEEFFGLETSEVESEYAISKFDLTFSAVELEDGLDISIEYSTELFERKTIDKLAKHLEKFLEKITEDPDIAIDRTDILTEEEKNQQLEEWNSATLEYPKNRCIHELFEEQVEKNPDAVAVVFEDKHLTYGELNARSNQLARYLRKQGVKADDLVGLCVNRSLEMIIGILGILKSGGAYVPLDPSYPKDRLDYMKFDSGAKIAVDAEYLQSEAILQEQKENLMKITSSQNLAYVIYTSGSTGKPKGAQLNHQGVINHLFIKVRDVEISDSSVVAQTAKMSFDISVWQSLAALICGGTTLILKDDDVWNVEALVNQVNRNRVTIFEIVPTLFSSLLSNIKTEFSSLKRVLLTGEALNSSLCREWFKKFSIPLINAYGPTECSDDITHNLMEASSEIVSGIAPIGHSLANLHVVVIDGNFNLRPRGCVGEIVVYGDGVGRGYLNRPDLTAEKFIANPFGNGGRLY